MTTEQIAAETVAQGRGEVIAQILHRSREIASQEAHLEREREIVAVLKATFPDWPAIAKKLAEHVADGDLPTEYLEPQRGA